MDNDNNGQNNVTVRKSLKRKLDLDSEAAPDSSTAPSSDSDHDIVSVIRTQVNVLNSTFSSSAADRAAAKRAIHVLSEIAMNEETVDVIVECGAVPALVKHLQRPPYEGEGTEGLIPYEHEVEKGSAFTLGLLSIKPDIQHFIADSGGLPHLVDLLRRHRNTRLSHAVIGVIKRAADTITNIAHENNRVKSRVRLEGGIPPLVELLEFLDTKVQKAAAGALRTLAFQNDKNKKQIVECNALPTLVLMLHSEDATIHYEAVGVVGNLVHSSPNIKREVLMAGALQPVISLLRSPCVESRREAALLLGQFATADSDCKIHIVQRGAVPPLVELLESRDAHLKEMSAFALGRLAQEGHNQAGIAKCGAIAQLLKLLDSKHASLQHNAAFALYSLSENEDNVADFVRYGGVKKFLEGQFIVQPTKDCVSKTLKRLEENMHGRVLKHLLYLMGVSEKAVQRRVVLSLAHLCSAEDQSLIFIEKNGLELLLELIESTCVRLQREGSAALFKLSKKCSPLYPTDGATSPATQVYLGEQFVNNPTLSDVSFLIEGKRFYAHRICLLASSDAFRAMFDGSYRERDSSDVEIPNIRWEIFELMMRFIYTGSLNVTPEVAHDLLRAADQYLLDGLKLLCEKAISEDIRVNNVLRLYELSETYNAGCLRDACILFALEQFDTLHIWPMYSELIGSMRPHIREFFIRRLSRPTEP